MPNALKVKQFGLPRWVWLVALGGGAVVGLYIRAKRAEQDATSTDPAATDPTADPNAPLPGDEGLPVGFYGAAGGASLPDAQGPSTTEPFDLGGFMEGLAALGIGSQAAFDSGAAPFDQTGSDAGARGPKGKAGKAGRPGKRGRPGHDARKHKKHKHHKGPKDKVIGGGGPPKRPAPKVIIKPRHHKRHRRR